MRALVTDRHPIQPVAAAAVLEMIDVRAGYGDVEVLHGISLSVPEATVVALVGPNGAGKSTLLRVASGQIAPSGGCLHVTGRHVNGIRPDRLARAGVCTLPEGRGIFPNLTVAENLKMMTLTGASSRTIEETAFGRFPKLRERRGQLAGTLSGGEQQMLAMVRSLATAPALLLLDEISMGLAPQIVTELYELIAQIAREGIAILLVEQFTTAALEVADRAVVVVNGVVVREGDSSILATEDLSALYLGTAG